MIMVLGDVHRDWPALNALVNQKKPDIILQCGDFGYWPKADLTDSERVKLRRGGKLMEPNMQRHTKLYWCDGNHEDFWGLRDRRADEIWPGVYYKPRGSRLKLPDGRWVLFMGGAASIDKLWRIEGVSWFPEEEIKPKDMDGLDPAWHIDIVISHTCPLGINVKGDYDALRLTDWSRAALSEVMRMYNPKLWYFGHWHTHQQWQMGDTLFTALNMSRETGWWEILHD